MRKVGLRWDCVADGWAKCARVECRKEERKGTKDEAAGPIGSVDGQEWCENWKRCADWARLRVRAWQAWTAGQSMRWIEEIEKGDVGSKGRRGLGWEDVSNRWNNWTCNAKLKISARSVIVVKLLASLCWFCTGSGDSATSWWTARPNLCGFHRNMLSPSYSSESQILIGWQGLCIHCCKK